MLIGKTKKIRLVLTAGLMAGLFFSQTAQAEQHRVLIDPGAEEEARAVARIMEDTLTARGYEVTVQSPENAAQDEDSAQEILVKLQRPGNDAEGTPVLCMTLDHGGDHYAASRLLAQSIMNAYTTATQHSQQIVTDDVSLEGELPSAVVCLGDIHDISADFDLALPVDQAWTGYVLANGVDSYFADLEKESGSPEESVSPAPADEKQGMLSPTTEEGQESVFQPQTQQQLRDAQKKLSLTLYQGYSSFPTDNGDWALYACDLKNAISGYAPSGADRPMQAASLIKLYIMGAVYAQYDDLSAAYGEAALEGYLRPMITVSDNDAANALVNILGGGDSAAGMRAVNEYCRANGYTSTSMGRLLLASKENGDNYTSVRDCGRFLANIYRSVFTDASSQNQESIWSAVQTGGPLPHAQEMFSLLSAQERRNKIPAALPENVLTANKTGELGDVENDAGIIYATEGGNDLVLVFMSENLRDTISAQQTIASVSRMFYDEYHE